MNETDEIITLDLTQERKSIVFDDIEKSGFNSFGIGIIKKKDGLILEKY